MNDNFLFIVLFVSLSIFFSVVVGMSKYSDIKKAESGLQECYIRGHANPIWVKECKGE